MLNRIFVRENCDDEYNMVKSRFKIGVVGLGEGVGTSLVSTSLAKELSKDKEKHVAFVEISNSREKSFIYDSIGIDKRFGGRTFFDFYEEIAEGKSITGVLNLDERINWALCVPENSNMKKKKSPEVLQLYRLINNIKADIVICDITYDEKTEELFSDMEVIVGVIDPLPAKLINNYDLLCKIKKYQLSGQKVIWVINKYNDGINKREFSQFVKLGQSIKIPMLPASEIYSCEYNCRLPYCAKPINLLINEPIKEILHLLNT